jgi:hypothetical protein
LRSNNLELLAKLRDEDVKMDNEFIGTLKRAVGDFAALFSAS